MKNIKIKKNRLTIYNGNDMDNIIFYYIFYTYMCMYIFFLLDYVALNINKNNLYI